MIILQSPVPIQQENKALEKTFSAFLQQDKQFLRAVREDGGELENLMKSLRIRRDAEEDQFEVDMNPEDGDKKDGFFDRAAKFVMELVQRFLKWINTDSN